MVWSCLTAPTPTTRRSSWSHANAALTPRARLRLARLIVEHGWPIARAAERFQVSWPTAKRWADRYRAQGAAGMADRSSRPHRSRGQTPAPVVRKIVHLRWKQRLGPGRDRRPARAARPRRCTGAASAAGSTGSPTSTGPPASRCAATNTPSPATLLHVDVKKLGNIPDGGGWRFVGRAQGERNRAATPRQAAATATTTRKIGTAFVHTVLDDHSRVAYAEIHDDETAATATAVLRRRGGLVRRPRRHRRAGALGQRLGLPLPPLARHLRRARHHPEADPPLPAPDQRQDRTLPPHPGRRLGLPPALPSESPAEKPCRPGSTSTTITGPTPPSAGCHPSPG